VIITPPVDNASTAVPGTPPASAEAATDVPAATGEPEKLLDIDPAALHSRCVLLKNIDTGEVLYALAEDARIYPASLTKIMTALLTLERLPDGKYEITESAIEDANNAGASTAGFNPGEITDKASIVAGILLPSAAECSFTAARQIAGDEAGFVALMNQTAAELGMNGTHFANCTGLHNDDHYTTVRDLMKLVEYALKNPEFTRFFTSKEYIAYTEPERRYPFTLLSTVFTGLSGFDMGEVNILGGKTGFTRPAGLCLASYAEYKGNHYVLITAANDGNLQTERYHFIDAQTIYGALQKAR
ncbi:MAG: D-alanyl-D-alanine carboxypeptidase, partial [Clostridia bacterium]|nr:D-alanyl-D-alanine carboxypeptidase [Clostridia bacterium]